MDNETKLREYIRRECKRLHETNAEQQTDWFVDKILQSLDAATNKKADYQFAAAVDSDDVKKAAKDIKKEEQLTEQEETLINEFVINWLTGAARNWGNNILDRRKGYLDKAIKTDPKLKRMAKQFGIKEKDFEKTVYDIMKRDRRFIEDLASGKMRAKSAYRF